MNKIGVVEHFYSKISVAVVALSGNLSVGDTIQFKGATTDFKQNVKSMQVEHESLSTAKSGQKIGLKVDKQVRPNDEVFLLDE